MTEKKGTILSGMRPTGKLHLGHLVGALYNWVSMQDKYNCYFLVADLHVLTTGHDKAKDIPENARQMVLDWISVGLDPENSPFLIQSLIPEHSELNLILGMITPMAWVERNPTIKEMINDLDLGGKINFGLMGYPVLQAADILLYRANLVPVGEDQVAHVEMTREIARRFNNTFGEVFPEPREMLTESARLPGTDGRKMSKSIGNCIYISDNDEDIQFKLRKSITDPQKIRRGDPGRPEVCPVFAYQKVFNSKETGEIESGCRSGALGCVDCKKKLGGALSEYLAPIRERRAKFEGDNEKIRSILLDGSAKAGAKARETMKMVRDAIGIVY